MHTSRTVDGSSLESMLFPPFRKVEFQEDFPQVLVSTQLRHAWTALPGEATTSGTVGEFIKANYESTDEQRAAVPKNPDKDILHTAWRDEVYRMFNHLFYDVSNWLQDVGPGIGHMHLPSHDVLALEYSDADGGVRKKWETDILIIPVYLEPRVEVIMDMTEVNEQDQSEKKVLGTFDGGNSAEIWYVRAGTEVQ